MITILASCYGDLADSISEDIRLEEKIDSLSNLVTQQNYRINELLSELNDLQSQVSNNNSVIDSLTTISQINLSRIDSLDSAFLSNLARIDSLSDSLNSILSELLQNTTRIDSIIDVQNDNSELSNILASIDSLSNDINDLQNEMSAIGSSTSTSTPNEESLIYFEDGICKCPNALPNHSEIVDGVRYFVVDNVTVYDYVNLGRTNLCTSLVTNMRFLFSAGASGYIGLDGLNEPNHNLERLGYNIDISFWDTSNVHSMENMFWGYDNGFSSSINNWDVSNVRNMTSMFKGSSLNQDISSWDVSSVTDMQRMFREASVFNQDLSIWNVTNVTDCSYFDTDAANWTLPKPNFTNCTP